MENNINDDNNKKTLILSILEILVWITAVVGVSFAMYKFTGTGTQENVITTGTVNMSFDNEEGNNISLTNEYPMTDEYAIQSKDTHKSEFTITANLSVESSVAIAYSIGIDDQNIEEGETLKKEYIKIALLDDDNNILVGTPNGLDSQELTGGTLISELESQQDNLINKYMLAHKLITGSNTSDKYTLYAWVADTYNLPTGNDNKDSTLDENVIKTEEDDKTKQEKTTKSETFKFKLIVKAKQLLDEEEYEEYQQ